MATTTRSRRDLIVASGPPELIDAVKRLAATRGVTISSLIFNAIETILGAAVVRGELDAVPRSKKNSKKDEELVS